MSQCATYDFFIKSGFITTRIHIKILTRLIYGSDVILGVKSILKNK